MQKEPNYGTVCFYIGKPCRYGSDAPVEEQMECNTCPAYIMWRELVLERMQQIGFPEQDT